jgi:hypothetical protein
MAMFYLWLIDPGGAVHVPDEELGDALTRNNALSGYAIDALARNNAHAGYSTDAIGLFNKRSRVRSLRSEPCL